LIRWLLSFLLIWIPFGVVRLLFLAVYPDEFGALGASELILAFVRGLRFDGSSIAVFGAIPFLLYHLPGPFRAKPWRMLWHSVLAFGSLVLIAALVIDLIYFGHVHRHLSFELANLAGDWGLMFTMAAQGFLLPLVGFGLFGLFWFYLWVWLWHRPYRPVGLIGYGVIFLLLVTLGRGGFGSKPIAVIDAYNQGSVASAGFSLNGVFTSSHAILQQDQRSHHFFDLKKAAQLVSPAIDTEAKYPLLHQSHGPNQKKNLVFILVESLSASYVDYFGQHKYGVTPFLDQLSAESHSYTQFFASGQRSLEGIQLVLTGVPSLIGMSTIGEGFQARYSSLGHLATKNGYDSLYVQAMARESFRGNSISGATGFQHYYGKEDIPNRLTYPDPDAAPFGWDYETLMFSLDQMKGLKKPFVSFIVTSTTHTPYPRLDKRFEKYPHSTDGEGGFLNALAYTDWSLSEFFKAAAKEPWYDDTIFVITADHAMAHHNKGPVEDYFHIPLILYSPKAIPAQKDDRIGSQIDVLPTLIELLGLEGQYAALGQSLLSHSPGFGFMRQGDFMAIVTQDGLLRHSLSSRVDVTRRAPETGEPEAVPAQAMEDRLLALDQLTFELLQQNRWSP